MSQDYDAIAADFVATRNRPWEEFECWCSDLETLKAARCLDLGCGGGRFRDWLPKKIVPEGHYFGQDISAEMIQLARAKFSAENFQIGSMTDLSAYEEASMEVVSAIASFHHLLSATEQRQCLAEVFRVLKPGGFFLATSWVLPQRFFWRNILRGRWKNWLIPFGGQKSPRWYRRLSVADWQKLLREVGFIDWRIETSTSAKGEKRNIVVRAKKPASVRT